LFTGTYFSKGTNSLGDRIVGATVETTPGFVNLNESSRKLGSKQYELSNHLGNVLVTVSDKKIPEGTVNNPITGYVADVTSSSDYYPFGMQMSNRNFSSPSYRYGFNGMEKDDEMKGSGNSYDFGARLYNPRLGRFNAVDQYSREFASYSPYSYGKNNPVIFVDKNGDFPGLATLVGGVVGAIVGGVAAAINGTDIVAGVAGGAVAGLITGAIIESVVWTGGASAVALAAGAGGIGSFVGNLTEQIVGKSRQGMSVPAAIDDVDIKAAAASGLIGTFTGGLGGGASNLIQGVARKTALKKIGNILAVTDDQLNNLKYNEGITTTIEGSTAKLIDNVVNNETSKQASAEVINGLAGNAVGSVISSNLNTPEGGKLIYGKSADAGISRFNARTGLEIVAQYETISYSVSKETYTREVRTVLAGGTEDSPNMSIESVTINKGDLTESDIDQINLDNDVKITE
jgi:RHS repeat-associated protein